MTRNLSRLAVLVFALSTAFGLSLPRPALAQLSCGTGAFFVGCSKKCCGPGVTTTYNRTGIGSTCSAAKTACRNCLPACPSGQSLCAGPTVGTICGT